MVSFHRLRKPKNEQTATIAVNSSSLKCSRAASKSAGVHKTHHLLDHLETRFEFGQVFPRKRFDVCHAYRLRIESCGTERDRAQVITHNDLAGVSAISQVIGTKLSISIGVWCRDQMGQHHGWYR